MKNLTIVGVILLAIGLLLFYLNNMTFNLPAVYGALSGVGIGLICGGIVGYISKGSAVKEANKNKQLKQLQIEKEQLETRQEELIKKQQNESQNN